LAPEIVSHAGRTELWLIHSTTGRRSSSCIFSRPSPANAGFSSTLDADIPLALPIVKLSRTAVTTSKVVVDD
ncbi:hypothetical protein Hamer_G006224, partial [Homarus americanus]